MCSISIDEIMEMLDWNNSREEQLRGIELAREVKCINVFLQPGKPYGGPVWDNCALIVSEKNDEELEPYLVKLMEWLEDMNWLGAFCILDRLTLYSKDANFERAYEKSITCAKAWDDEVWESNLRMIKERPEGF